MHLLKTTSSRAQAALHCAALGLLLISNAHAQTKLSDENPDGLGQASSANVSAAPTGISQATQLARPTDTVSNLAKELGKVGADTSANKPNSDDANRVRSRTPARPEIPTQFQRFVQEATGKLLPYYGSTLFEAPYNYAPDSGLAVPSNYILGPGDEIRLQVWGAVDFSATLVLDRNGQILVPKVGVVPLTGVAVKDLEPVLRASLAKVFTNFSLNANLGRLRGIQIYVVGQARQPGTFVVSSLSTLVNALFVSGGPNANGSMRQIQLQRGGKTVSTLDLYDFIARGDKSQDLSLLPGDVIVIPPAGPRVAVTGAYDQAAIYELKNATSSVGDILALSGGTPALTNSNKAILERINPGQTPARQVTEIALDARSLKQPLRDGDVLTLLPISRAFNNAVTLRGNVAEPLRYAFKPGMRVSDLIPEVAALIQPDYYVRKNVMVQHESGLQVSEGRVINEVKNLLEEINWEYAVIERLDAKEVRTVLIPFNLGKAVKNKDPAHNLVLQSGDVVTIFGVIDLPVPMERRSQFVRVGGEVMVPGTYQIQAGETLPDIIKRAGGMSRNAFPFGMVFTRESTRAQQQENLNKSILQMEAQVNAQAATALQNIVDSEKGMSVQAQIAGQRLMLSRLQGLKANGRIALDMDPDNPAPPPIALEDGDRITVPHRPSFVGVFGEVLTETAFLHKPSYMVNDYLEKSGLTRDADTDNVMVIRADGTVESNSRGFSLWRSGVLSKRLYPGDTVFVPGVTDRRSLYATFIQGAKDWTAIFYQFGLGAAGIKTLRQ